jgi:hypothetical protein
MKKILLLISAVAIIGNLQAQNTSENHRFVLGLEYGATTSLNYSALSAFEDNTASYTMPTTAFFLGLKSSNTGRYWGLSIEGMTAQTSQPSEKNFYNTMALLSTKRSLQLTGNINVWYGCGVGAAWLRNQYTIGGDDLKINRYGLAVKFEGGLIYNVNSYSYVGLTGGFLAISLITDNFDAPAGYAKNQSNSIFGRQIMLNYGVRF